MANVIYSLGTSGCIGAATATALSLESLETIIIGYAFRIPWVYSTPQYSTPQLVHIC